VEEAQVLAEGRCWIGWRESVSPGCQHLPWKLKATADLEEGTENEPREKALAVNPRPFLGCPPLGSACPSSLCAAARPVRRPSRR
jgi:hypothetical protein